MIPGTRIRITASGLKGKTGTAVCFAGGTMWDVIIDGDRPHHIEYLTMLRADILDII